MTPLALRMWERAQRPSERQALGDLLSSTQFFACSALAPFIDVRMRMPDARMATIEMLEAELPASKTWLDFGKKAILLSDDEALLSPDPKAKLRFILLSEHRTEFSAFVMPDGSINTPDASTGYEDDATLERALDTFVRGAWFAIEAMQTPGMTHRVEIEDSRQQRRANNRAGKPCHKWVEIRLGRGRKSGGTHGGETGRKVAWHYRRGHSVNHPNPNYPKWRKGCWAGTTDAGIRTHNYVVEVPE